VTATCLDAGRMSPAPPLERRDGRSVRRGRGPSNDERAGVRRAHHHQQR
jgi:hypothetical protein